MLELLKIIFGALGTKMKPERIELKEIGARFYLSLAIGSFSDVLQVLALVAWGLANQSDWKVGSVSYENEVLKVSLERTPSEEPPGEDGEDEEPPDDEQQPQS